jgi:hypothetical protein
MWTMRSKTKLAASFVVTIAALGCDKAGNTGALPPPTNPPTPTATPTPTPSPTVSPTTAPANDLRTAIEVDQRACFEHTRHMVDGQFVDAKPPRKVDCPKERVYRNEQDKKCFFTFPDPCQHEACNPPRPQEIDCPPGP